MSTSSRRVRGSSTRTRTTTPRVPVRRATPSRTFVAHSFSSRCSDGSRPATPGKGQGARPHLVLFPGHCVPSLSNRSREYGEMDAVSALRGRNEPQVLHRCIGGAVFAIAAVQFFVTAPTVLSWTRESSPQPPTCSRSPIRRRPPLLACRKVFYLLPMPGDPGFRMKCRVRGLKRFSVLYSCT